MRGIHLACSTLKNIPSLICSDMNKARKHSKKNKTEFIHATAKARGIHLVCSTLKKNPSLICSDMNKARKHSKNKTELQPRYC